MRVVTHMHSSHSSYYEAHGRLKHVQALLQAEEHQRLVRTKDGQIVLLLNYMQSQLGEISWAVRDTETGHMYFVPFTDLRVISPLEALAAQASP